MKVEQLASLLGKDATELAGALNLAEGVQEVESDIAVEKISNHIKEIAAIKLREGKQQGEGMAKRLERTEFEKKLKGFGLTGDDLDTMLQDMETKFKTGPDETKYKDQISAWKSKATSLEVDLQKERERIAKIEQKSKVKDALGDVLGKFDFASPKVASMAINEFVESYKFIEAEDTLMIEVDGKPSVNLAGIAERHFSDYGKLKSGGNKPPQFPNPGGSGEKKDLGALMEKHRKATTAAEKALILGEIKKISTEQQ